MEEEGDGRIFMYHTARRQRPLPDGPQDCASPRSPGSFLCRGGMRSLLTMREAAGEAWEGGRREDAGNTTLWQLTKHACSLAAFSRKTKSPRPYCYRRDSI